ncbi:MAG: hypothetical protein HGA45_31455, partial [Chloroflexales bacterium]|nr:hypothetical protein [Chloroflexales bacterium]
MRPAHVALLLPMLIYALVAAVWHEQRVNPITGDEPHYLLTADSIIRDGDLRVVNNHQIDTPVLRELPPGAVFTDTHTCDGYSLHGIGLPLLLVPAYYVAGVGGAKLWMALLVGLAPLAIYRLARSILGDDAWAITVALLLGLGPPFIIGSNQIYPDLLAGLILFYLLVRWRETLGAGQQAPSVAHVAHISLLLALLPWLHIKLALPALLLYGCYMWRLLTLARATGRGRGGVWLMSLTVAASLIGLGLYDYVAFHTISGPYQRSDATTDVRQIGMILLGLHLDRMQGLFVQAPIFLLGVFGLALFAAEAWPLALVTGLLYLSVIIPNAAHTNWYGGMSFAGRFHWTGALLWSFPLLYGLRHLRRRGGARLALGLMIGALLLESIFVSKVLIPNAYVYNAPLSRAASWTESDPYADFFDLTPTERAHLLPSFRDFDSYLTSAINWLAGGLLLYLLWAGYCALRGRGKAWLAAAGAVLIASLLTYWGLQPPGEPPAAPAPAARQLSRPRAPSPRASPGRGRRGWPSRRMPRRAGARRASAPAARPAARAAQPLSHLPGRAGRGVCRPGCRPHRRGSVQGRARPPRSRLLAGASSCSGSRSAGCRPGRLRSRAPPGRPAAG